MNYLRTLVKKEAEGSYLVYWTNSEMKPLYQKGCVRVKVDPSESDAPIIAELHAMQYLLEVAEVSGENRAGDKYLTLIVSAGAIRKLARMDSAKKELSERASFLTTRFSGCNIKVDKEEKWLSACEPSITLNSAKMREQTVEIQKLGKVYITAHAVDQFTERFYPGHELGEGWRKLVKIASDSRLREVDLQTARTKLKYSMKGKEAGRYFFHPIYDAILVIVEDKKRNKLMLVTAYKVADPWTMERASKEISAQ